jgi:hypothetical protein
VTSENKIAGAVVYFGDIKYYCSEEWQRRKKRCAGFRLLAVRSANAQSGYRKATHLGLHQQAKQNVNLRQMIIHTTKAMQTAWKMYESIGFKPIGRPGLYARGPRRLRIQI